MPICHLDGTDANHNSAVLEAKCGAVVSCEVPDHHKA